MSRSTILELGTKWGLCKARIIQDGNRNGDFQNDYQQCNTTVVLQSPNPSPNSSLPLELYEMTRKKQEDNHESISIIQRTTDIEDDHIMNPRYTTNPISQNGSRGVNNKKHSLQMKDTNIYTLSNRDNVMKSSVGKDFNSA